MPDAISLATPSAIVIRAAIAAALAALAAAGCASGPRPCVAASHCDAHHECLANRCVPRGSDPVDQTTRRVVVEPRALAVVNGGLAPTSPPAVVTFGGAAGRTTLLLAFEPAWRGAKRVESAFLLLEPAAGTVPASTDVDVTAFRVRERWDAERLDARHLPQLSLPRARGIARTSPPLPLRIDVTELIAYLHQHPHADRGLALRAAGGSGHGASYSTGAGSGRPPRLELYLR